MLAPDGIRLALVLLGVGDGASSTGLLLCSLLEACSVTHRLTPRLGVLGEALSVAAIPSGSAAFLNLALLKGQQHLRLTNLVVNLVELLVPVVVLGVVLAVLAAPHLEPVADTAIGDLLAFELATVHPRGEDVAVTGRLVLLHQSDDGVGQVGSPTGEVTEATGARH